MAAPLTQPKMKVFVSGGTGKVGSNTLRSLFTDFKDRVQVKAGIYMGDKLPFMLHQFNIDTTNIDFADSKTVIHAVKNCDVALAIPPQSENRTQLVINFIDGCKQAGVKHIVLFSATDVDVLQNTIAKQFLPMEHHLKKCGMQYTILRSNFFMDNMGMLREPAMERGELPLPLKSNGSITPIATTDIGVACASLLADPNRHASKTYTISGPEELTGAKHAEIFSRVLNKSVRYVEVEPKQFKDFVVSKGFMPEWQAQAITDMFEAAAAGKTQRKTKDFEVLTNRTPMTMEHFLRENKKELFGINGGGQQAR